MASGKNTATTATIQISEPVSGPAIGPPPSSPRNASAISVTGLMSAHAFSQPGMVDVPTNTLLPNVNGITPLMAAAGNAQSKVDTRGRYKTQAQAIEAIHVLLDAGANIDARDSQGQTALFGAAIWGWNDVVHALADRGARLDIKDSRGRDAADAAMGLSTGSGRAGSDPQPQTAALLRQLMASTSPK